LFFQISRDNLDPFRVSNDIKIWEVLEKCHVKDDVEAAGGLDIHVKEAGTSFSVGQRQLLCLARALLKSAKVIFFLIGCAKYFSYKQVHSETFINFLIV
jgi:ABC-type multidrug transport system fused ATPase/permease subunit